MLILTRRTNEKLIIDNDITVTVLAVKGKQVRLGITAPQKVSVHREEIQKKINAKKQQAEIAAGIQAKKSGLKSTSDLPVLSLSQPNSANRSCHH